MVSIVDGSKQNKVLKNKIYILASSEKSEHSGALVASTLASCARDLAFNSWRRLRRTMENWVAIYNNSRAFCLPKPQLTATGRIVIKQGLAICLNPSRTWKLTSHVSLFQQNKGWAIRDQFLECTYMILRNRRHSRLKIFGRDNCRKVFRWVSSVFNFQFALYTLVFQ